ncbi:MAG: RNA polymerase subunit sigma-70 [Flavobacteriia bacterium]|nr:MAG: RNA polymerase subunit sigma-70 [Flavobacteriia bacterium]
MKFTLHPRKERTIIEQAILNNRVAQKQLFDRYAADMLKVCRRFIKDLHFAEDVMIKGFTKAFKALKTFDRERQFDVWLRQIMINESLSFLRSKQANSNFTELDGQNEINVSPEDLGTMEQIQEAIDLLPQGFKTVFLLYVVEGYKHEEIAEQLHISVGTSKSQLSRARQALRRYLIEFNTTNNE